MLPAYKKGALARAAGVSKLHSHSEYNDKDWQNVNEIRRGWGDMDTWLNMAEVFAEHRKSQN